MLGALRILAAVVMRRPVLLPVLCLPAALLCCAPASAEERILIERSEVLEAIRGRVDIRQRFGFPLRLPAEVCDDGKPYSCAREREVLQLYAFDLHAETLSATGDWESATVGRLRIAADLATDAEDLFEQELDRYLAGLAALAFRLPRAGWSARYPFGDGQALRSTTRPCWICVQDDEEMTEIFLRSEVLEDSGEVVRAWNEMQTRAGDRGGSGVTIRQPLVCPGIVEALPPSLPVARTYRTSTEVLRSRISRVSAGLDWSRGEERVPHSTDTLMRNAIRQRRGVSSRYGIEFSSQRARFAALPRVRSELPPPELESSGFTLTLTVEQWDREFGAFPLDSAVETERIEIYGLPVTGYDPQAPARLPDRFDETVLEPLAEALYREIELAPRPIAEILIDLQREALGGWLMVLCDGSREIVGFMPPLEARIEVENGGEFCRAAADAFRR